MFSVATEADARLLIVGACKLNQAGQYYAPELADAQTFDNLKAFSDRLLKVWGYIQKARKTRRGVQPCHPPTAAGAAQDAPSPTRRPGLPRRRQRTC